MSAVMTAIGIGWGITWFTYAADYSRFVSTAVPKKKVYLASVLGQFIPVVWLGILGASLATNSGEVDPGKLIVQNFGVMALPVLLMVLHGPIATNILNIYTFSVATQALDITISRRKLNLFVGVFSLAAVVFFIFQEDFAAVLDAWLIGLVAWVAAWGGVMLVHYFWLEKRWPGDAERLFDAVGTRRLPGVNWAGVASLLVGIFATWLFMYGLVPAMQGPIAVALGGWDLSWLAGGLTSAGSLRRPGPAGPPHATCTVPGPDEARAATVHRRGIRSPHATHRPAHSRLRQERNHRGLPRFPGLRPPHHLARRLPRGSVLHLRRGRRVLHHRPRTHQHPAHVAHDATSPTGPRWPCRGCCRFWTARTSGPPSSSPVSPPSATRTSSGGSWTAGTRLATTATCTSPCRGSTPRPRPVPRPRAWTPWPRSPASGRWGTARRGGS